MPKSLSPRSMPARLLLLLLVVVLSFVPALALEVVASTALPTMASLDEIRAV